MRPITLLIVGGLVCALAGALGAQATVSTGVQNYASAPVGNYLDEYYFDVDFGAGVAACDLSINITNTGNLASTFDIFMTDPMTTLSGPSQLLTYNPGINYGTSASPAGPGSTGNVVIWGPNSILTGTQGSFPLAGRVRFDIHVIVVGVGTAFPQDITVGFSTSVGTIVPNTSFPLPVGTNMGYNIWSQNSNPTPGILGGYGRAGNSDFLHRNYSNVVTGVTRFGDAADQMEFFIDIDLGSANTTLGLGLMTFAFAQPGSATGSVITELFDMQVGYDTPVASATASTSVTGVAGAGYDTHLTASLTGLIRFRVIMRGQGLTGVAYGATTFADFGFELYLTDEGRAQTITVNPRIASPRMAISPASTTLVTSPATLTASGGTPTVTYNWTITGTTPTGVSISPATGTTTNLTFGASTPTGSMVTIRCTNNAGPEFTDEIYTLNFGGSASLVSVVASDASAGEPSDNGAWTVTFSPATTASTDVNFSLTGAAALTSDYTLSSSVGSVTSSTLTVPAGTASAVITLTVVNDSTAESSEDAILTLTSATAGYSLGTPTVGTITITDEDGGSGGTVSISATDNSAGEPADNGQWTITFTGATTVSTNVNFNLTGSATLATDYTLSASVGSIAGSTLTVPGATGTVIVTLNVVDDGTSESTEDAIMTLSSATQGYAVGSPSSGTIVISDDDGGPSIPLITIVANGAPSETGPLAGTFTLTAIPAPSAPIQVNVSLGGTATQLTDYNVSGITGGQVTISSFGSATVTITPIDDATDESAESVILTLLTGTGYTLGATQSASLNIADNDTGSGGGGTGGGGGGGGGGCVADSRGPWMAVFALLAMFAFALRLRARRA